MIEEIRRAGPVGSYADVGCCDGFVTSRIVDAIQPATAIGLDYRPDHVADAQKHFPQINFRQWNLMQDHPSLGKFDVVTCLEMLEHVAPLSRAVESLLSMTGRLLIVTVPIEIGFTGLTKFLAKLAIGRPTLVPFEHEGSRYEYLRCLVRDEPISSFRRPLDGYVLHAGFDYRELDALLRPIPHDVRTVGWNRMYLIRS